MLTPWAVRSPSQLAAKKKASAVRSSELIITTQGANLENLPASFATRFSVISGCAADLILLRTFYEPVALAAM